MIHVEAGQYAYLADATPIMGAQLADGKKISTMMFNRYFSVAKDSLEKLRPDLASKLVEVPVQNRATYSCAAVTMDRSGGCGCDFMSACRSGRGRQSSALDANARSIACAAPRTWWSDLKPPTICRPKGMPA